MVAVFGQDYQELLWAAASIAIASGAGATMAVWRRREGWAFSASLGTNLAASLVVWYFHRNVVNFGDWWLQLVEANVIASSAVALAWLAARRRLYQLRVTEKGDSPRPTFGRCPPERPEGCFAQMGTVPFFRPLTLGDSPLLATQIVLPLIGMIAVLALPVVSLVEQPASLPDWLASVANIPGWLALLFTAAAGAWYLGQVSRAKLMHVVAGLAAGTGVLVACHVGRDQSASAAWLAYHTLTTAWATAAFVVLAIGWIAQRAAARGWQLPFLTACSGETPTERPAEAGATKGIIQGWATIIGAAAFALRGDARRRRSGRRVVVDRGNSLAQRHCGSSRFMVAAARLRVCFGTAAECGRRGRLAGVGAENIRHAAASQRPLPCGRIGRLVVARSGASRGRSPLGSRSPAGLLRSLGRHRRRGPGSDIFRRGRRSESLRRGRPARRNRENGLDRARRGNHRSRRLSVESECKIRACRRIPVGTIGGRNGSVCNVPRAAAVVLVGGLGAAGLRRGRRRARLAAAAEQVCRPVAANPESARALAGGMVPADSSSLDGRGCRIGCMGFVGLCVRWNGWRNFARRIRRTARRQSRARSSCWWPRSSWPPSQNRKKGTVPICRNGPKGASHKMGTVPFFRNWRALWQYATFAAAVLLLASLGWARLDLTSGTPAGDAPWLHCSVILMAAAVLVLLAAGLGLGWILPKQSDWIAAGRRAAAVLGSLSVVTLVAVLVQERTFFDPADKAWFAHWAATWEIAVVAAAMLGLVVACLACALVPRWDSLRLSDRGRTAYVYAAEALLALAVLHLRVTMPGLFKLDIIRTYWMLIVMVIAFLGAGLSVLFHRRKMDILSEPLERTVLFLPMLPSIGFAFLKGYANAGTWFVGNSGPAFWLMTGAFYGVMAVRKRSILLAALGILAGNLGLWVQWHHWGLNFLNHPQLWLIPIAMAALVAEHLDRRRLNNSQRLAIRYLALSVIYVSSTTEFWRNIGQSAVLPMVTILLAVVGVLVGILLRERSFLYLGFTFLVVVIGRMIVYAAFEQRHIWIFWASCIVLGAAIIALFALFEKRRNDVLASVERFKQWKQ